MQLGDYLDDLIQDKPSSELKLLAAWDGLSTETQIKILHTLKGNVPNKLKKISLSSNNSYIRFLTVKYARFDKNDNEDKILIDKIRLDESPLVRHANSSNYSWLPSNKENSPEYFFSLPQETRIAILSSDDLYWPGFFTEVITWAIETQTIPENEIHDLTKEFIKNSAITEYFTPKPHQDALYMCQKEEDLKELWHLTKKLPSISTLHLIKYLPTKVYYGDCIPEAILQSLNNYNLMHLFNRDDMHNSKFRKEVFFATGDKYDTLVRATAISKNCRFEKSELDSLIKEKRKDLLKILHDENDRRPFLLPVFTLALDDLYHSLKLGDSDPIYYWNSASYDEQENKILKVFNAMDENEKFESLISISLYKLAKKIAPWPDEDNPVKPEQIEFKDGLEFLEGKAIIGDTWGTYLSFKNAYYPYHAHVKRLLNEIKEDFNFVYPTYLLTPDEIFPSNDRHKNDRTMQEIKIDYLYFSIKQLTDLVSKIKRLTPYLISALLIYYTFK